MINNGADLNILHLYADDKSDKVKYPILYHLLRKSKIDVARWFIDQGADVNALDDIGWPILLNCLFLKNWKERSQILIDKGANINAYYTEGQTKRPILYRLFTAGLKECAEWLIEKGVNVNAIDDQGYPILLNILLNFKDENFEENAQFLIDHRANVNAKTQKGQSILSVLLMNKRIDRAIFLLKNNAHIDSKEMNLKTISGKTIEEYINESQNEEFVNLMKTRLGK